MINGAFVTAIIAGAGNSTRMNGINKLMYPINGTPVIALTLSKFNSCDLIDEIIVSARKEDADSMRSIAEEYSISKLKTVVEGGNTRAQSVINAVSQADKNSDYILVHDGARPLVEPAIICKSIEKAFEYNASAVGVKVKDTIKEVNDGFIINTVDRNKLWAIHTPQVFKKELYLDALSKIDEYNIEITDDSMLVEMLGERVAIVDDLYSNIKITTQEDILIAEQFLNGGSNNA